MAGLETCLGNLVGLATAHRPAVPPRGERATIPIIAIANATDHCSPRVRGVVHNSQARAASELGAAATGLDVIFDY